MNPADALAILHRQADRYRRLVKLAELQSRHVRQSESEALLSVLTSRQQLIDEIGELDASLSVVKGDWKGYVAKLDHAERVAIESAVAEIRELLGAIVRSDHDDSMVLQQRKAELSKQLGNTNRGRRASLGYAAAGVGTKTRLDLKK